MATEKLKSVKMSESVHTDLKVFVAQHKIKNITSFVDEAVVAKMKYHVKKVKK